MLKTLGASIFASSIISYNSKVLKRADQETKSAPKHKFAAGVKQIPHPQKAYKGGEDAYVLSDTFIAVADGVGGWNDVGVDPALFSKELCLNLWEEYIKRRATQSFFTLDLKSIFVETVKRTKNKGSSTMVIAGLDPQAQGVVKTLNLGDSGYLIARKDEHGKYQQIYRSPEQLYGYDFPFQCGTNCDLPYDSDCRMHIVQDRDIFLLASDGIFDNLYDKDILDCLTSSDLKSYLTDFDAENVATCVAKKAEKVSTDPLYDSPYAKHARDYNKSEPGGKVDDITVIVAQVIFQ
ncbi:hypothetical protein FGO68_gene11534 [Halteria grandinella]|uniref:Protein phosphatase n=1 Tax=Halteria grandinella TaxID=5974 RepID=A0A8J8NKD2_HALGN|nr:hypothetical protein FGO68_gene11534 [Halteria grandinella]